MLKFRDDLLRTQKPLDEITPDDVPRGFDPEDVCAIDSAGHPIITRCELEAQSASK